MNPLVPLALFGWIPFVLWLFKLMPLHRAVIAAFILAWLFLPVAKEPVLGLRWTKMRATCYGLLLASLMYDAGRFQLIQWNWRDLPMLAWCVCPFLSSMTNDLGIYDGISQMLDQTITWGLPYVIGRAYLGTLEGIKELAIGIILGGLAYVPFCLVEIRVSPQWHTWIYGYFQHEFSQTIRFGGYRPVVFMEHGLAVGAWMTTASLAALWLWRIGVVSSVPVGPYRMRMLYVVGLIGVTTVLCKSSGALGLGIAGAAVLYISVWARTRLLLVLLLLLPVAYVYGRAFTGWSGMDIAEWIATNFDRERAASFVFRLENEDLLVGRALECPVFGWGGWGRSRVYDLDGKDLTVADGLWIIALGDRGLFGLVALGLVLGLPAVWMMWCYPAPMWRRPDIAPAAVLAISLVLFLIDGLFNAMMNPVFVLVAGGLNGLDPAVRTSQPRGGQPLQPGTTNPPRARRKFARRENSPLLGVEPCIQKSWS